MEKYIDIKDASVFLGVSISTMRSWVRDNKITYRKIGRFVRFTQEDLDSFVIKKEAIK